ADHLERVIRKEALFERIFPNEMVFQHVPLVAARNFSRSPIDSGPIHTERRDVALVTIVDLDRDAWPFGQVPVLLAVAHYEKQLEFRRLSKCLHRGGRPFSPLSGDDRHVLTPKQVKQLLLLEVINHGGRCTTRPCLETSAPRCPSPWCSSPAKTVLSSSSPEK